MKRKLDRKDSASVSDIEVNEKAIAALAKAGGGMSLYRKQGWRYVKNGNAQTAET